MAMGTHFLLFQLSFSTQTAPPSLPLLSHNNKFSVINTGSPHWAWKNSGPTSTGWSKSNLDNELYPGSGDYDDEFGYSGTGKKRVWWFDDEEEDDDDWGVNYDENEFWVFKVIKGLGWMLPAVAISFRLGTDSPNAFFMALAIPLGQTALALVMDKVWEITTSGSKRRPRTKTRKKPFARAASKRKTAERKAEEYKTNEGKESHRSWMGTEDGSHKASKSKTHSFGGWDDLDKASYKTPERESQSGDNPLKQDKGKLSRRGRVRDRPLLLRLLIAVFPFLGSWTKFLF